jgi:glycosyltransferase involved in cell wall biosynthesis
VGLVSPVVQLEATETDRRKLRVLMVCAHEPAADPRISWAARWAASAFDVTVIGFAAEASDADIRTTDEYRIVRLRRGRGSVGRYLWLLKDVATSTQYAVIVLLILIGAPILLMTEVALSLASMAARRFDALRQGSPRAVGRTSVSGVISRVRNSLLGRLRFIFYAMRHQFAPSADLFGQWIRRLAQKPDIIHCNDLDTLLVGIVAKVRFGSRVVYDAHEFYPESHVEGRWLDTRLLTALERYLIRKADAVVTVNPMLAEVMRRVYGLAHVYSVPNAEWWIEPGDRSPFHSRMTSAARGRVKVLFQGRFADGRGIEELLEGWAQVDGDRAALFLRGPDNTSRRSAIEQARTLALLDRSVFFLDPVPEDMLVSAAAEADIGVIPYRPLIRNDQFSCPNKLSQYLHAGLMVVTNDLPYVKSVIHDAGAGLSYDSSVPTSFAAVINRTIGDRQLLDKCRQNALRYARQSFNWQCYAKTLEGLYRNTSLSSVRSSNGVAVKQPVSVA